MTEEPTLVIDTLGRRCPIPVIELARHLDDVEIGAIAEVLSDDPASSTDIPVWCRMKGHEYVGCEPAEIGTTHRVRRAH